MHVTIQPVAEVTTLRVRPETLASSATKRAKGDPVPTFLQFFYNNEVGRRRLKPVEDPSPRWIVKRR